MSDAAMEMAAIIDAVQSETAAQHDVAVTQQVETATDASVEVAKIEADASVAIAGAQAEAAVEIAKAQADDMEVDEEWLALKFAALADGHEKMLAQLAEILSTVQALAAAVILPQVQSIPTAPLETPAPETAVNPPPPESAAADRRAARTRRFI